VSVTLGPDSSANAETERAWLSRMATRYGGRLELEGATESILLPADGAHDQREVADLRRELEAAQRQGEAYARELAAVFSYSQSPPPRFSSQPVEAHKTLGALCAMASGMSAELRSIFSTIERELTALREAKGPLPDALAQQTGLGSEIVIDLVRLGQCPIYESVQHFNLADAVRSVMADLETRATKRGVHLKSHIPGHLDLESRPATSALLARTLISDAILASPRDGQVTVSLEATGQGALFMVADDGPPIPNDALAALFSTRLDPSTLGRPSTIALFWAQTLAQHLGAQIELGHDESRRGCRIDVKFAAGA
jgi:signal transduction histidine kinase